MDDYTRAMTSFSPEPGGYALAAWQAGAFGGPFGYEEAKHGGYSPRDLLRSLFRRRRFLTLFALTVMSVVLVGILLRTPVYQAQASILVKKGMAQEPLTPRPAPMTVWDELLQEDVNTEIGILKTRVLVRDAMLESIEALPGTAQARQSISMTDAFAAPATTTNTDKAAEDKPEEGKTKTDRKEARILERDVDDVMDSLKVEQEPRSNIIQLRFLWPDPKQARRFLEALIEGYQQRRSELFEPTGAEPFFRRQAAAAAAELKATEEALNHYLNEAGLTLIEGAADQDTLGAEKHSALEHQQRIANDLSETRARISQLESLLTKTQTQILAESRRLRADLLERQRAALRAELQSIDRDRAEQEERLARLGELQGELATKLTRIRELEDKLRGLLVRGQGSLTARQLKAEVDALYKQLAALGQVKRYDLRTSQDTRIYDDLDQEKVQTEVTLTGLRRRAELVREQLAALANARDDKQAPLAERAGTPAGATQNADRDGDPALAIWMDIEATRQALSKSSETLAVGDRESLAQGFEGLVQSMLGTEAELAGARARAGDLTRQLAEAAQELGGLNVKAARAKELRRELERNETNYLTYMEKSETAAISAAMAREELVNTSVAEPPSVLPDPVGPSAKTLLLLGMFLATFGGAGIVFLLDFIDHRIDTPEQLEHFLGLEHLASVPEGETEGPLDLGLAAMLGAPPSAPSAVAPRRLPSPA